MKYIKLTLALLFILLISIHPQVRLPKLISDGMVLQRDANLKIWGWASVNEKVTVNFLDSVYTTSANNKGEWMITLPGLKTGGPFVMEINASNKIIINDIMIGDVWVCSGQSNMEINMNRVSPLYEKEIANAENPSIRYFEVPDKYNFNAPQKDLQSGKWQKVTPKNVLNFSAVCYFYAKELYDKYKIPIGLINSALGGSPVESWISEDALKEFPKYYNEAMRFKDSSLIKQIETSDRNRSNEWYNQLREKDEGYKDKNKPWYSPDLNTSDWDVMNIPGYWSKEKLGPVNGAVWFRKDFDVPASMAGKPAKLFLGRIVDADSVFVNGAFIGTTGYQYPPRRYTIPASLLKEGKNTIVVRVISNIGDGGFVEDKPYEITEGEQKINLTGNWKYRLGTKMEPLQSETFIRWKPLGLFNSMIAPLLNLSIKGVIWYQGEANTDRAFEYRKLLPALINDWRNKWNQGNFPFLFVQLPNFMKVKDVPSESDWALLRESQLKTLSVPNTGMAVAIDWGEWNDIHPLNKKEVGRRLALSAQHIAYNDENVVYSGPIYKSMKIDGNKIILAFTNVGSGLIAKGNCDLKKFEIAGTDKRFVWAKAEIKEDKIIVWSDRITNPIAVRYAWADNPDGANLYNKEGLPASPFRTDEF